MYNTVLFQGYYSNTADSAALMTRFSVVLSIATVFAIKYQINIILVVKWPIFATTHLVNFIIKMLCSINEMTFKIIIKRCICCWIQTNRKCSPSWWLEVGDSELVTNLWFNYWYLNLNFEKVVEVAMWALELKNSWILPGGKNFKMHGNWICQILSFKVRFHFITWTNHQKNRAIGNYSSKTMQIKVSSSEHQIEIAYKHWDIEMYFWIINSSKLRS